MPLRANNFSVEIQNEETEQNSPWYWWRKLRDLCEENSRLGVVLELTPDIVTDENEIDRWFSEPVKCLVLPTSIFLTNKSGFPVLSKPHQALVNKFLKVKIFIS